MENPFKKFIRGFIPEGGSASLEVDTDRVIALDEATRGVGPHIGKLTHIEETCELIYRLGDSSSWQNQR